MTNDGEDVCDPVFTESWPYPEVFGECADDLSASTGGVGKMLDIEVTRVANHPLRQVGCEQWFEGAVLVDGDLVTGGE